MANIRPFCAERPVPELASRIAALPYDVYNRAEAKAQVEKEPLSFLKIDRAETQLSDDIDTYDTRVYSKAAQTLGEMEAEGDFMTDSAPAYYLYQLTMDGRSQTGIVACASIDDYINQVIKKHENTREEKEQDRIHHVDTLGAQTGPIFLAYRSQEEINSVVDRVLQTEPLYQFTAVDGIGHGVWKISDAEAMETIATTFAGMDEYYIADGHHRAASAVKVGLKRREEHPDYDGTEEFNYFLSVLFPDDQLMIMDYNRCVSDLNGLSIKDFLQKVQEKYSIIETSTTAISPKKKGEVTMYLEQNWYRLQASETLLQEQDVVAALDVSLIQDHLLEPVLGIKDPRTDDRIDFIGGIRGLQELERRVSTDMKVAFAMYPTSIQELFQVADAGRLMPPKSTWFEPKLRSGLFIHKIGF